MDREVADEALVRRGKSETAFRTISEVSEELDVPQHVLRFWESKFSQIRPLKRGGGRRYYRPEDVALLRRIRDLLYRDGYTIKGVQKLLRETGVRALVPAEPSPAPPPVRLVPPVRVVPADSDPEPITDPPFDDDLATTVVPEAMADRDLDADIEAEAEAAFAAEMAEDDAVEAPFAPSFLHLAGHRELEDILAELMEIREILKCGM